MCCNISDDTISSHQLYRKTGYSLLSTTSAPQFKACSKFQKDELFVFHKSTELWYSFCTLYVNLIDTLHHQKYLFWKIVLQNPCWTPLSKMEQLGFLYRNNICFSLQNRKTITHSAILSTMDYRDILYAHPAAITVKPLDETLCDWIV